MEKAGLEVLAAVKEMPRIGSDLRRHMV